MRCIETLALLHDLLMYYRLIETWDVLKLLRLSFYGPAAEINRNMRCIETYEGIVYGPNIPRLIETWDVLKRKPRQRNLSADLD